MGETISLEELPGRIAEAKDNYELSSRQFHRLVDAEKVKRGTGAPEVFKVKSVDAQHLRSEGWKRTVEMLERQYEVALLNRRHEVATLEIAARKAGKNGE